MNTVDLVKVLQQCFKANVTPLVWGQHGIGKSQIVQTLAEEMKYECVDLRLGQMEVGDLIGLPSKEDGRTVWLKPSWFPKEGSVGILFLDELNRARLDVLQAIFQLVLEKKLHTHHLPEGWRVVCASNPSGSDYFVNELDPALLDRFLHIQFRPEPNEWIGWGKDTGKIREEILDLIARYHHLLGNPSNDLPLEVLPSPRSWEMLSRMLNGLEDRLWLQCAMGLVGKEAAIAFIESLKKDQEVPIKAEEILSDYGKVKARVKKHSSGKKARLDLLRITGDEILRILAKEEKTKALSNQQKSNLVDFLDDLPVDLAFALVKELVKIPEVSAFLRKEEKFTEKLAQAARAV
ncbi:MAG: MoxR family ATPase [Candidatus Omnitrophota bacterium]